MVTDNGIPQLSSTTRVVIAVEDINDHSPEFDQKVYKVQIPSNAKIDQSLFQVCFFLFYFLFSSIVINIYPSEPFCRIEFCHMLITTELMMFMGKKIFVSDE